MEHLVPRGAHRLYARDHPGEEPAIVLLHGFPDDLHLYDRLLPELAPRRVVAFDFDPFLRHALLHGLDPIARTLTHEEAIAAYENDHGARVATTALTGRTT